MRWVETILRLAGSPSNDDGVVLGLESVAHRQDQRPGIYTLIEETAGMGRGEALEGRVRPLLHTPALVPPHQPQTDLEGLGELNLVLNGQV